MRVLFFSMHGSAAADLALLCAAAGVEFWLAAPSLSVIRTKTKEVEIPYLRGLGAKFAKDDAEAIVIMSSPGTVVVLSSPGQVEQYKAGGWKAPFVVRHGLNSFDKFKAMRPDGFISASRIAMGKMPCAGFLTRKLIPWEVFPKPNLFPEGRRGFSSFIHDYKTKWPREYAMFVDLNRILPESVVNYGHSSEHGVVDDLEVMKASKATVHIKGGNAVCNAVIRSMAVGTPVVMERSTFEACHFDCIKGILVADDIKGVARKLVELSNDEGLLEEECLAVYKSAKEQFVADAGLAESFKEFLVRLLP